MARPVVIALPDTDFDPTEAAVPWRALRSAGHEVVFATERGEPSAGCDREMLTGVMFGAIKATRDNAALYEQMEQDPAYATPIRYTDISPGAHAALVLPGGHAPGMRQYLEALDLQRAVAAFFTASRPVAAICHGTVVLARSRDSSGQPVLRGRTLTGLPRTMEWSAWIATVATRGNYFRTYPTWVQTEVAEALGPDGRFETGPLVPSYGNPFTVRDGNLLTARWPGDASRFAADLVELLADEESA